MNTLKKLNKRSLSSDARISIMNYIVENRIAPGSLLPKETEMAAMLGVSRSVVREAIISFRNAGILEPVKRKGTILKKADPSLSFAACLPFMCMEKNGVDDILLFRYMLEKGAAEVAALKRDDNDIAVMENTLNDQKKLSGRAFVLKHSNEADIAFHLAVLKSAHSELMYKMSSVILAYFNTVYTTDESVNTDVDAVEHEHEEILKAIKARDPQKAGAFMGRHLLKKNEITA